MASDLVQVAVLIWRLPKFWTPWSLLILPIHHIIGQNHHHKKWNFKSFPTMCRSKQFHKVSSKCSKTNCAPWVRVRWKLLQKRHNLMSLLIRFWDREPISLSFSRPNIILHQIVLYPHFICESYINLILIAYLYMWDPPYMHLLPL